MLTIVIIFVIVITVITLFIFYTPLSHMSPRSNSFYCKAIQTCSSQYTLQIHYKYHYQSLCHIMLKLLMYLLFPGSWVRGYILFMLVPWCLEINKLSTNI